MQKTNYYKEALPHFPLDAVFVGRLYDGVVQKRLHRFKFVHNTVDTVYFETIFRELIEESGIKNSSNILIVYPPISLKDRLFRGPNHAKKLAKLFAKMIGSRQIYCPFQKNFFAGHQSHRNKIERRQILSEYTLKKHIREDIGEKEIIIIDDIITTGYTMFALGKLLKTAGGNKITGFFLASHKV